MGALRQPRLKAVITSSLAENGKVVLARAIDGKARFLSPLIFSIVGAAALLG